MKNRIGWKSYFVLLSLLYVGTLASILADSSPSSLFHYVDSFISGVALAGVFGYAFRKKLLHERFWCVLLPIFVVWDIWFNKNAYPEGFPSLTHQIVYVMLWIFIFLEYFALYLYGYRSKDIWTRKDISL